MATQHATALLTVDFPAASTGCLAKQLKHDTRSVHEALESTFAVNSWLGDREAYADLLVLLQGFYGPLEDSISRLVGWGGLTPAIEIASHRRAALVDGDLDRLRAEAAAPLPRPSPPRPGSLASGLGCLYVLAGSALGGAVLARRARVQLGPTLPIAFLSSAQTRSVGADWRDLTAALNSFGDAQSDGVRQEVVAAAQDTFLGLSRTLAPAGGVRA